MLHTPEKNPCANKYLLCARLTPETDGDEFLFFVEAFFFLEQLVLRKDASAIHTTRSKYIKSLFDWRKTLPDAQYIYITLLLRPRRKYITKWNRRDARAASLENAWSMARARNTIHALRAQIKVVDTGDAIWLDRPNSKYKAPTNTHTDTLTQCQHTPTHSRKTRNPCRARHSTEYEGCCL